MKNTLFILIALVFAFTACKKDNDFNDNPIKMADPFEFTVNTTREEVTNYDVTVVNFTAQSKLTAANFNFEGTNAAFKSATISYPTEHTALITVKSLGITTFAIYFINSEGIKHVLYMPVVYKVK